MVEDVFLSTISCLVFLAEKIDVSVEMAGSMRGRTFIVECPLECQATFRCDRLSYLSNKKTSMLQTFSIHKIKKNETILVDCNYALVKNEI